MTTEAYVTSVVETTDTVETLGGPPVPLRSTIEVTVQVASGTLEEWKAMVGHLVEVWP